MLNELCVCVCAGLTAKQGSVCVLCCIKGVSAWAVRVGNIRASGRPQC